LQRFFGFGGFGMNGRTGKTLGWLGDCNENDLGIFAAATSKVTIGNGKKAKFWDSPWLDGVRQKDLAPLIHDISASKKSTVCEALANNSWVSKINMQMG
jgi:hypothetical protein